MLSYLRVHNFHLIDHIELELQRGFTVFSGETGAGKSMLLSALSFALGGRGAADYVGPHADELTVELQWQDPDGEAVIIQRRYHRDGRGVIKRNGSLISLGELEDYFSSRILRQEQGQAWLLKKSDYARQLLDDYGHSQIGPLLEAYQAALLQQQTSQAQRDQLSDRLTALEKDAEFLEHELGELQTFFDQGFNEEQLLQKRQRLLNVSRVQEHAAEALRHLEVIEEQRYGLVRQIENLQQDLGNDRFLAEATAGLETYLSDLRQGVEMAADDPGIGEDNLEDIERQLQGLRQLRRKYGTELEAAFAKVQVDVALLRDGRTQLRALTDQLTQAQQAVRVCGLDLSKTRVQWGKRFATAMLAELKKLGFTHPQFKVAFAELPLPGPYGLDQVQLLFSANPDVPPQPLQNAASGGELSRILLAFYVVSGQSGPQTLIFDEVDVGLGGKTATLVGEHLRKLSENAQILAITHLPQVAAQGIWHVHVSKSADKKHTVMEAAQVAGASREKVLALMLGAEAGGTALKHAKELLKR